MNSTMIASQARRRDNARVNEANVQERRQALHAKIDAERSALQEKVVNAERVSYFVKSSCRRSNVCHQCCGVGHQKFVLCVPFEIRY